YDSVKFKIGIPETGLFVFMTLILLILILIRILLFGDRRSFCFRFGIGYRSFFCGNCCFRCWRSFFVGSVGFSRRNLVYFILVFGFVEFYHFALLLNRSRCVIFCWSRWFFFFK